MMELDSSESTSSPSYSSVTSIVIKIWTAYSFDQKISFEKLKAELIFEP